MDKILIIYIYFKLLGDYFYCYMSFFENTFLIFSQYLNIKINVTLVPIKCIFIKYCILYKVYVLVKTDKIIVVNEFPFKENMFHFFNKTILSRVKIMNLFLKILLFLIKVFV